jgi:hypothetical protein
VNYTREIITRKVFRVIISRIIVLKCNPSVLQDPSMSQTESHHTSPSPALVRALRQVLRPLVRVMLAQGITLPYMTELLKSLLVEVAEQDFRIDGKSVTDSRVSLLSGVHRKDVNRLRRIDPADHDKVPSVVSLGGQLAAQWLGNPLYVDAQGQPKPLARYISEAGAQSFEGLVAGVNSDIRSRVVLDEWLRLGVVHMDEQRRVCLNTQAFVPAKGFDEKAFYFGHNLHDHAAAAAHNLLGQEPPFMERSVHYSGLSTQSVALLAAQSQELGMQALLAVNKTAMEREKLDAASPDTARQRMTLGVYFYSQPAQPEATQAAPKEEPDHESQP